MNETRIEVLLEGWANRVRRGRIGPQGFPSQSWSRAAVARKGGKDSGLRTARGSETRCVAPPPEDGDWGMDAVIEAGVSGLKDLNPILWSVGVAYYLGHVPIGFRASHKLRRRRFSRDDTTGLIQVNREFLNRLEEETEAQWKARLARRLTMTPRVFDYQLVRFHDCLAMWVAARNSATQ